jgi:hypothetical protein
LGKLNPVRTIALEEHFASPGFPGWPGTRTQSLAASISAILFSPNITEFFKQLCGSASAFQGSRDKSGIGGSAPRFAFFFLSGTNDVWGRENNR